MSVFTKNKSFIRLADTQSTVGCNSLPSTFKGIIERTCGTLTIGGSGGASVNYFEAGTVAHPFTGSVGSPVSSDPNFTQIGDGGFSQYYGDYATVIGTGTPPKNNLLLSPTGIPEFFEGSCELLQSGELSNWFYLALSDTSFDNEVRIQVFENMLYVYVVQNNIETDFYVLATLPSVANAGWKLNCIMQFNDDNDVLFDILVEDENGAIMYAGTEEVLDAKVDGVNYGGTMFAWSYSVQYNYMRIEGSEFPYNE